MMVVIQYFSQHLAFDFLNSQPSLFSGSPIFTVEPFDTVVDSGSTVVLNCQAQGEPTPVIEWASQGRPLLSNDRITILSGQLGRSALGHAVRGTEQGSAPAVSLQPSMEEGPVRAVRWKSSCAASNPALVSPL
uniref:Ig-like domain-containing protein n=1 Tax=Astyanax mexicanus TaxID=7994 RepID=A0A3B1JU88_ASTMX